MTTSSGTDYYTTDELGSITATRDSSGGLRKSYTYEPYGALRDSGGTGAASTLRFAGGLSLGGDDYRFGLRQYSAGTATFTTPDPAGSGETYGYASGNPVVFTDPLGLYSIKDALQDVGRIAGNAFHGVTDPLLNNSVVRSALDNIGTGLYAGGRLLSRALKTAGKFVWEKCAQNRHCEKVKTPDITAIPVKIGGLHRAVAVGFEPTVGLSPHIISSDAPSAARTRHRGRGYRKPGRWPNPDPAPAVRRRCSCGSRRRSPSCRRGLGRVGP